MISPSSTSLLVTWDHPLAPDRNGIITGYTVIRQAGSETSTAELFTNATSRVLEGLLPFTGYNITVAGNTSAGQGEFTNPITIRTLSDRECREDLVCILTMGSLLFAVGACKASYWYTLMCMWFQV